MSLSQHKASQMSVSCLPVILCLSVIVLKLADSSLPHLLLDAPSPLGFPHSSTDALTLCSSSLKCRHCFLFPPRFGALFIELLPPANYGCIIVSFCPVSMFPFWVSTFNFLFSSIDDRPLLIYSLSFAFPILL